MSRQRFIYPEFFESSDVGSLSIPARLLFVALFTLADDYGRGRAAPARLRGAAFPYDHEIGDLHVDGWLKEIRAKNPADPMVRIYRVRGAFFYWLPKWEDYQTPKHRKKSKIPPFDRKLEVQESDTDRQPPLPGTEPDPKRGLDSIVLNGTVGNSTEATPARPRSPSGSRPGAAANELVRVYVESCGTSPASDATFRSAQKLVAAGLTDEVRAATAVYAGQLGADPPPTSRRIKPHNWFGQNGRWKEYRTIAQKITAAVDRDGKIPATMPGDDQAGEGDPVQTWRWNRQGAVAGLIAAACARGGVHLERHAAVHLAYRALEPTPNIADLAEDPEPEIGTDWKPAPWLQKSIDEIVGKEIDPKGESPPAAG